MRPVSKGTSTRRVRSIAPSILVLSSVTSLKTASGCSLPFAKCSRDSSWHSPNDICRLFHQLADGAGQPGGEQQQRSQGEAHCRDVARGNSFACVLPAARTEQKSGQFVQHAAEDDDERAQTD